MGRFRVIEVNLHLYEQSAMVSIQERSWRNGLPKRETLARHYLDHLNVQSPPSQVLEAVARILESEPTDPGTV